VGVVLNTYGIGIVGKGAQVAPLQGSFPNLHSRAQAAPLPTLFLENDPDNLILQSANTPLTHRGTASLIAAARRLIATAIIDDPANQFFALVSQNCIPLHSFEFVYNSLFEVNEHQVGELKGLKYKSFIEIIDKDVNLWDRYTARGNDVMLPEVKFEDFRVGSQFFTLTRRHAMMVVKERRLWKKFRLPCLRPQSCYPEEHYFPTFLGNADPDGCAGYTLTRVNWTDSLNGHPHTYYPSEVSPELIYELRRSSFALPYMFARKFSPDCLKPLMDMADESTTSQMQTQCVDERFSNAQLMKAIVDPKRLMYSRGASQVLNVLAADLPG
ncbi:hypothetical protein M8C21_011243, partial [Ambrosia artemisiifolia]